MLYSYMKCITCKKFSIEIICSRCQKDHLKIDLSTRVLPDGFKIHSFYNYSHIEDLIKTKHTHLGHSVYTILAKNTFKNFSKEFLFQSRVYAIGVDDHVRSGYSHTAILTKSLKSKNIVPLFSKLRAKNLVTYSSKSLQFRLENPREFEYTFKPNIDLIIVDDVVTTSSTINEAKNLLKKEGTNPMFALTLADAREP